MQFQECPLCGSPTIQKIKGRHAFIIKSEKTKTPIIQYWKCPNCGEAFFDHEANRIIDEALLKNRKPKPESKSDQSRKIAKPKPPFANRHASL